MKKIILPALAAVSALGLAACDGGEATTAETETVAAEAEVGTDPAMTQPVVEGGTSDSISISEDGVTADINEGGTSVTADVDSDPTMTVETD